MASNWMTWLGWLLAILGLLGIAGTNILFTLPPIGFGLLEGIGLYLALHRSRRG